MNGWQGFTMSQSGRPPSFPHIFDIHRKIFVCVRGCVCVCVFQRERRLQKSIIMPTSTGAGSRGTRRKEGRRLCLELSKCGTSGPQSLYQCHSSIFFSHLSAQWLFFPALRAGKTFALSSWMAQHNRQPFSPHLSCSCYLFTQQHSSSKCSSYFLPIAQSSHICAEYWNITTLHLFFSVFT